VSFETILPILAKVIPNRGPHLKPIIVLRSPEPPYPHEILRWVIRDAKRRGAVPDREDFTMKRVIFVPLIFSLWILSGCAHGLSLHSKDGESLSGRYRFAREDTGLIQVAGSNGETLNGKFVRVPRTVFAKSYEQTFGAGSIAVDGPDPSRYGNGFGALLAGSSTLTDSAHGESYQSATSNSGTVVHGPLFYWTASLLGDRGTTLACYLIGSSYTGHGLGRCKSDIGKEYSVEF
jgi:hypothetical protein